VIDAGRHLIGAGVDGIQPYLGQPGIPVDACAVRMNLAADIEDGDLARHASHKGIRRRCVTMPATARKGAIPIGRVFENRCDYLATR
jgi:hypothetical protein